MSEVTKPIALDESFNTTGQTPKNIADVIKNGLQEVAQAIDSHQGGGGHVILDQNGNALDQEPNMQFVDAHTSDDSVNTKTIIENIKSVTEAQFESATEDGLYDVDVEGAEIGEISEEYVEVTADGDKTYQTLLNELYAQIDLTKININSKIRYANDILIVDTIKSSELRFIFNRVYSQTQLIEEIVLSSSSSFLQIYNGSYQDQSANKPTSGTKITLYYGNDKAVVDLQTTANRCLMPDGTTTVAQAINGLIKTYSFTATLDSNGSTGVLALPDDLKFIIGATYSGNGYGLITVYSQVGKNKALNVKETDGTPITGTYNFKIAYI